MEHQRAILFADIAGSTGLYEQSGDTVALEAVVNCLDCLKAETLAHGGRVIKTIGDELMAVFDTAAQAIQAANAMQSAFEKTLGGKAGIKLRIGCRWRLFWRHRQPRVTPHGAGHARPDTDLARNL
ncbi:MAG: hypothetical protein M0Q22_05100 [Sulfuritalea sp.]|jgi:adenylate cyclase|nr:hypothetical protein [Sulfuritalea sp.]